MLNPIVQFSIKHRFFVVLVTSMLAILGLYSFTQLPIDAVPDITNNQVQINTVYPAFAPTDIEKRITFPVETALAGIPGLDYTRSISRNGFSQVTAVFSDETDIYFARQQVGERLLQAKEILPREAEPGLGPISTGLGEVYMWVVEYSDTKKEVDPGKPGWQPGGKYLTSEGNLLSSEVELAAYLREVQDWIIRPQLAMVKGVAGVDSIGGYLKQFTVEPDPQKLLAFGLSFNNLIEALERNNISTGAGYIENRGEYYVVRGESRLATIEDISSVVIGERKGIPIRIKQIGKVHIGKELRTGSASTGGEEAVVGTALMLIGENSRTVAAAVHEKLEEINRALPPGIIANPVLNRTKLVDATISTVSKNLFEAAVLVIVVLFVFLGNFRAALITALAIPLSMLMTVTGMVQTKISGNLMSLGAIDFGLIVDGAVIIMENCVSRISKKQEAVGRVLNLKERLQEILVATKEMIQPSVFGQAIIITVYIPILFLTGVEGKMFQPMAITVIFALASAFLIYVLFTPAMAAIFLTGNIRDRENFLILFLKRRYQRGLNWAVKYPKLVISIAILPFLVSIFVFFNLGQVFVPALDEGDIAMHAMRIPSTSLSQSQKMQFEVEEALQKFSEIKVVFSKTGTAEVASDPMPPNVSDTFVILKPRESWPNPSKTKLELVEEIQEEVMKLPGNNYEFTQPIQMRFNELISGVRGDVAVKVFGEEFEKILPVANSISRILKDIPGAADVKVEQVTGLPTLDIDIDREQISRLGIDALDVHQEISAAIGGQSAGFIFQGDRRFSLVVRLADSVRKDIDSLEALPIPILGGGHKRTDSGEAEVFKTEYLEVSTAPSYIPLKSIATLRIKEGPNQISRENGKRRIVVQANIRGRDLGGFVEEAQQKVEAEVKLPPGSWLAWGGQFENLVEAKKRLSVVVPICFLLILLLLFTALGSVREALVVFTGVPLALTGGIFALWLRGIPFSISAAVGFIALSGIAVLNGLVMVSRINQLKDEGASAENAVMEGALSRLRPVLMTALVAALGFVPMAIASGTGAEVQRPLATVVIGGLITATVLTLFVLPALLSLLGRRKYLEDKNGELSL